MTSEAQSFGPRECAAARTAGTAVSSECDACGRSKALFRRTAAGKGCILSYQLKKHLKD